MMRRHFSLLLWVLTSALLLTTAAAFETLDPLRRWFITPKEVIVDDRGLDSVTDGEARYPLGTRCRGGVEHHLPVRHCQRYV